MNIKEFTNYMLNNYTQEIIEPYYDKKGTQKNKIKQEKETKLQELISLATNLFNIKDLTTKLKIGPAYNRNYIPWIQLHDNNNTKGTTGEYLGLSFNKEKQELEIWFGFGYEKSGQRLGKKAIQNKNINHQTKIKTIEPNLQRNFQYHKNLSEAYIISKSIPLNQIVDEGIIEDLNYLAKIYNIYENQINSNNTPNYTQQTLNDLLDDSYNIATISDKLEGINVLYKGFPACGKSFTVKQKYLTQKDSHNNIIYDENNKPKLINPYQYEVITFYPEYTNANFIGSILPTTENNIITYKFIPGPFTKILKRAFNNPQTNFYLIIEELNRGNAAAIFGEIFTLLDRENDGNGRSTYEINNEFIAKEVFNNPNAKIYLPNNFSIIATMNSSDQNVIPLDTAFERRWESIWLIDTKQEIDDLYLKGLGNITWWHFRNTINNKLNISNSLIQTQDKKLGAYFINKSYLTDSPTNKKEDRIRFANKVLSFLYENVCKFDKSLLFSENINCIDDLIKKAESSLLDVFNEEIKSQLGALNEFNQD